MERREFLKLFAGLGLVVPLGNSLTNSIANSETLDLESPRNLAKALTWPHETEFGEVLYFHDRCIKLPESLGPEWSGELVITPSLPPNGVWFLTLPQWIPIEKKIMDLNSYDRKIGILQRLLVGNAEIIFPKPDGSYEISQSIAKLVKLPNSLVLLKKEKGLALHPVDSKKL